MSAAPLHLDRHGWLIPGPGVARLRSPNQDTRPAQMAVSLLVIHNISLPPGQFSGDAVERLFTNDLKHETHPVLASLKSLRVCAHFFLRRDGSLIQFAGAGARAWHAGVSHFAGRERCNDFSIGIEVEGADHVPYEAAQYETLAQLVPLLRVRYPLVAVRGHEHIAPGRKTDPGPAFDWVRFGRQCELPARLLPAVP